jgi:hypothetical protein
MNTPSKERVLVLAASFCQQLENSNMALKRPEGIFPVKDNSWLNCSDIWKKARKSGGDEKRERKRNPRT